MLKQGCHRCTRNVLSQVAKEVHESFPIQGMEFKVLVSFEELLDIWDKLGQGTMVSDSVK